MNAAGAFGNDASYCTDGLSEKAVYAGMALYEDDDDEESEEFEGGLCCDPSDTVLLGCPFGMWRTPRLGGWTDCLVIYICCFACCIVIGLVLVPVLAAAGLTQCPTNPAELVHASLPPAQHALQTSDAQWSAIAETDVFDPAVSNSTRVGSWRRLSTTMLREQYAYVPEGYDVPLVVATMPLFTSRTYNLELCQPQDDAWMVERKGSDLGILGHSWTTAKYEISKAGLVVAETSRTEAHWQRSSNPDGWKAVVTNSGKEIGGMVQVISHNAGFLGGSRSHWMVFDKEPGIVPPYVLSFLVACNDVTQIDEGNRRRLHAETSAKLS